MGLLDDLQPAKGRVYPCRVRTIAESLDEKDRAVFIEAINSTRWGMEALAAELTKRGLGISRYSIAKHRGETCSCSKT